MQIHIWFNFFFIQNYQYQDIFIQDILIAFKIKNYIARKKAYLT